MGSSSSVACLSFPAEKQRPVLFPITQMDEKQYGVLEILSCVISLLDFYKHIFTCFVKAQVSARGGILRILPGTLCGWGLPLL